MKPNRPILPIIAAYFKDEAYGLLGPQLAATIIQEHTPFDCRVVGVAREDHPAFLKQALNGLMNRTNPVLAFSTLCGREDLYQLAGDLKKNGVTTILAGPQTGADFMGETGWHGHPHRFQGFSDCFSYALHGPAETFIPFFHRLAKPEALESRSTQTKAGEQQRLQKPLKMIWQDQYFKSIDWNNLYRLKGNKLVPHRIATAQVIQQVGCPYAAGSNAVRIDPPVSLEGRPNTPIALKIKGCGFCDVASDKGYWGTLDSGIVLEQLHGLPRLPDGRRIPFELINENPLPGLESLIQEAIQNAIPISGIILTMRADWFVRGLNQLQAALGKAREHKISIILGSMGFESFDSSILKNLNKGLTVDINLRAVRSLRHIKSLYPENFGYLRNEGGNHGLIHPTPWDTPESEEQFRQLVLRHDLARDILPNHSTPLIIHHASPLGDWIRAIETRNRIEYKRYGSIIGWWESGLGSE